jgi:hypothetical protein
MAVITQTTTPLLLLPLSIVPRSKSSHNQPSKYHNDMQRDDDESTLGFKSFDGDTTDHMNQEDDTDIPPRISQVVTAGSELEGIPMWAIIMLDIQREHFRLSRCLVVITAVWIVEMRRAVT